MYRQLYNARASGAKIIYGAMFDEVSRWCLTRLASRLFLFPSLDLTLTLFLDLFLQQYDEATALMPAETHSSSLPTERPFLALDADGEELPDDWYLCVVTRTLQNSSLAGDRWR